MLLWQDVKAAGAGGPTRDFPRPIINLVKRGLPLETDRERVKSVYCII